jgi:hypothetical protein
VSNKIVIREEFDVHLLNEKGLAKAREIGVVYSQLLDELDRLCGTEGREVAIMRTKLQESAFFAKRAMAVRPENQQ